MMQTQKKKILFVGAGGTVADRIIPLLSDTYDIVGLAGRRDALRAYCLDFYHGDLTRSFQSLFDAVFAHHTFHSIIWNPARFFHSKLLDGSRKKMLEECDLALALPLECLRCGKNSLLSGATFIVISSTDAFTMPAGRGSYSILKRAQVDMVGYLARELEEENIFPKAIALGRVGDIPETLLEEAFVRAIENSDSGTKALYVLHDATLQ